MRKATLYVVVKGNEQNAKEVQQHLKDIIQDPSFSPMREQASLNECIEFYVTWPIENNFKTIQEQLNNDWTGEEGDLDAYGFNTKMFDPCVYYLRLQYD
ncbi:hypothetical protein C815_01630 [Firmicutes bacterium M10-2]|nr:hypothetical protein C815_01630 [Firmicutes bacterium M10-2]